MQDYSWTKFNIALFYFQDGIKEKALSELSKMLAGAPNDQMSLR
jgi:hypothetical protein